MITSQSINPYMRIPMHAGLVFLCSWFILINTACFTTNKETPQAEPPKPLSKTSSDDYETEIARLDKCLEQTQDEAKAIEEDNAAMHLQVLEQTAIIQDLTERLRRTEQELDGAINEVVRVKARLESLDSRAEAASSLAEAEIAVKSTVEELKKHDFEEEISSLHNLLKSANHEFKNENYSGSLYLSNRVQTQAQSLRKNIWDIPLRQDEDRFTLPLKLQTLKRSNIREGPGLDYPILETIEAGINLIGLSISHQWIRVKTEEGNIGWIFHRLVAKI